MRRSQRQRRRKVPVPVASMGDIAFLLIIFFMLLSEFAKSADLQIELPQSQHVDKPKHAVVARVAIDTQGQIFFDGVPVANADAVELSLESILEDTIADDQRHVQFKCDSNLTKETFAPVLMAIAKAGGIVEAVGEEPIQ